MSQEKKLTPLLAVALGVTENLREPGLSQLFLEAQLLKIMATQRAAELTAQAKAAKPKTPNP